MLLLFNKKRYSYYTKDNLFYTNNKWYWKWKKNKITSLYSKCSKCDSILVYDENKNNGVVYFYCPTCKSDEMSIKGGNYEYSQFILKREIKRNIFLEKEKIKKAK